MTTRSLFLALRRVLNYKDKQSRVLLFSNKKSNISRSFSSSVLTGECIEESPIPEEKDDLKSRIFRLRLPKRSATNVLEKWVHEGNQITIYELRQISKELRNYRRFKHALEISEWMVAREEFELLDSDYAVRIDLMTKVFGIEAAEHYFEGLPLTAKTCETYTALLHSYAGARLTERAEELFNRIKESKLPFNALIYNEMMTLYMSVGQVEKVPTVVEELKRQNIAPDIFTYNLWISSCAATLGIDEVRRILNEMACASGCNDDWVRYINLANIYVTTSHLVDAKSGPLVEAEKGITQREWITYDFLIILYAGLGNKDKIDQIWKSLRMTKQKMTILTELFVDLLKDDLNETIYQASMAKLETSVSVVNDKLELKVYGFNDKLPTLLSKLLLIAKSFLPANDRFKVIKENMERKLRNANMKPLSHSTYLRLQLLCKSFYDVDEKLRILNDLSFDDLIAFIPEFRSQLYIEGLCHGNLLEEEAINISNIFKSNFPVEPLPLQMRQGENVLCLPSGANLVMDVSVKNKSETNSVIELYFQIEPEEGRETAKLKAFVDLFDEIVEEPLFNKLRTKEQLGYVVECSPRITYRIHGFCFSVQSSKYNPVYLQSRIDSFINGLEELLEGLDDESFDDYKNGLVAKLLEKDPSLTYETNRFWGQIVDKRYMFDMSQKEADELRSIQKKDVIDWYRTYFLKSSPKRRRLAVRIWGCNTDMKEAEKQQKSVYVIKDVMAFKMSEKFYPSFC